jgi:hypothetical protein
VVLKIAAVLRRCNKCGPWNCTYLLAATRRFPKMSRRTSQGAALFGMPVVVVVVVVVAASQLSLVSSISNNI